MTKKVMVGMSGGVDSSMAATILMEQGYQVTGVTLKLWDGGVEPTTETGKSCCSLDDVDDARAVAKHLGIPFFVLDMKELFKDKVVNYFVDSYLNGYTPNPCITCNRHIKFGAMLEKAKELGFDFMATGHYANIEHNMRIGRYLLKKATDQTKDQSYVLHMLKQDQLERLLLPLGTLSKTDTRKMAEDKGLHISQKPDSQDICFIKDGHYGDFIKTYAKVKMDPGLFVDKDGLKQGIHKGIANYTIGQRKGLGIASTAPFYVIDKNMKENTIVLGRKEDIYTKIFFASDMNYIMFEKPPTDFMAKARVRYSAKEAEVKVTPQEDGGAKMEFSEPQPFVAPGQAVVLYDEEYVIGGGIIQGKI